MLSSDDDDYASADDSPKRGDPRARWIHANYDALVELYSLFRRDGDKMFGRAFYQSGGFHTFVAHIYSFF